MSLLFMLSKLHSNLILWNENLPILYKVLFQYDGGFYKENNCNFIVCWFFFVQQIDILLMCYIVIWNINFSVEWQIIAELCFFKLNQCYSLHSNEEIRFLLLFFYSSHPQLLKLSHELICCLNQHWDKGDNNILKDSLYNSNDKDDGVVA